MTRAVLPAVLAVALAFGCGGGETVEETAEAPPGSPLLNQPLPLLEVSDLGGEMAELEQFRGRVVILNMWATWCIPCLDEMPELELMHGRYPAEDFTVVGVSIDEGGTERVEEFLGELEITYPNFMGDGPAMFEALGLYPGVPHTLLLDPDGIVRQHWSGRFHPFEPETEALVAELLAAG